jgi:hypothetical protein
MSAASTGDAAFHHRARLFPLPLLAAAVRPPGHSSCERARFRFRLQRTIVAVTNRCICTLNRLYSPLSVPRMSSVPLMSQPDNSLSSCSCCRPSDSSSSAQLRVIAQLRERCAAFVLTARTWALPHSPTCNISPSALDLLASIPYAAGGQPRPQPASTAALSTQDSLLQADGPYSDSLSSLPLSSTFSSAPTAVVPLVAARISLPQDLHIVPVLDVLPPAVAVQYSEAASPVLLRSSTAVLTMDFVKPLRRPRVAGSRAEYVRLVARMARIGMLAFTAAPKAVNGVFAVAKDADSDRLIIDAQPANRLFVDSPHVALPGPSHLVQLCVPRGSRMFVGKTDLSNFYHHLGVPAWMQPYLALPPLTPAELAACGLPPGAAFPMCLTLPMGFSHAVFLAQSAHEHVVYSSGALVRERSLLCLTSPVLSHEHALHGIVIDDFFLFSLSQEVAEASVLRVLAAYRAAGFVVKQSKVVMPTSAPVKVIGFDIDGAQARIQLPPESQLSLVRATLAVLRAPTVTGATLAHVVGRWTWVLMLRRSALAVLQHAYRYCRVAQTRHFTLWPSVRRELLMLVSLLPLLEARLDAPFFHRAVASDASELAGGVVTTALSSQLRKQLWPLCSSRHHAVRQALANADPARLRAVQLLGLSAPDAARFDAFYSAVDDAPWRTMISAPWRDMEHINVLELRAALLAVHWVLSYPSSLSSRVFLLLDSTVAFFSLWKGRSSSPALLLVLRKISALLLAGDLSLLPGWVPSAVNPADAPSRLQPDACPLGRIAA